MTEPSDKEKTDVIAEVVMGWEKVTIGYVGEESETEWQKKNTAWLDDVGLWLIGDYYVDMGNDFYISNYSFNPFDSWADAGKILGRLAELYEYVGFDWDNDSKNWDCLIIPNLDYRGVFIKDTTPQRAIAEAAYQVAKEMRMEDTNES